MKNRDFDKKIFLFVNPLKPDTFLHCLIHRKYHIPTYFDSKQSHSNSMKHGIFGIYFQLTVKRMSTKHSKHPPIPMMHLTGTYLREFFFFFERMFVYQLLFLQDTLTQIITPSLSHTNYLSIQVDFDLLRCFVWFLQGIKGRPTGVKYCILTNIAFLIPLQTLWHLFFVEFDF